jgi:flagellar biogenesis protein FliO
VSNGRITWLLAVLAVLAAYAGAAGQASTTRPATQPSGTQPAATRPTPTQPAASQPAGTKPPADGSRTRRTVSTERKTGTGRENLFDDGDGGTKLPDTGEMLARMVASLAVLAVLGVVAYVLLKKVLPRVRRPGGRNVSVLETSYVGPRKAVHLLKVGRRKLLIASSRDAVCLLADVSDAVDDSAPRGGKDDTLDAS